MSAFAHLAEANIALATLAVANVAFAFLALSLLVLGQGVSVLRVWATCKGKLGEPRKNGSGGTGGDSLLEPAH